ncbi:MAG: hypothetical protein NC213_02900 [Acetobacter sp.]|nr:hypothetical protein [Bacteroides sp.]MCM1340670.1 hypothetical protein [Acetobacter sp.]MCM1433781.1 hypothetical protein [Clostridiales bacterium]
MTGIQIIIIAAVVLVVLSVIIFPVINRRSFRNLPPEQQVRIIMKEAKGLVYFKNVSKGSTGVLYYVKNKRKILCFPWVLADGKMVCTRKNPFDHWDYPEEQEALNVDELKQLGEELKKYNKKNPVKLVFKI